MPELPKPIPAATLVLMRPGRMGVPELLVVERASTMAFAAGALAFPGGRIDPEDRRDAAALLPGDADGPARIAAIRETVEESGIAPALLPAPDANMSKALRRGLAEGTPFAALLAEHGLRIDAEALTPFARWCPNFRETRRFDTLFFVAEAPADAPEPSVDDTECAGIAWQGAAEILNDVDAGRAHIIFPTRRNLERLACFASLDEARADAAAHPVRKITPWVEERGGEHWVCIPEDAGYPVTAERLATARRR